LSEIDARNELKFGRLNNGGMNIAVGKIKRYTNFSLVGVMALQYLNLINSN